MIMKSLISLILTLSLSANAHDGCKLFENVQNLENDFQPSSKSNEKSEVRFNEIIYHVDSLYINKIKNMNAFLLINKKWNDNMLNANASKGLNNMWEINMYGGLYRNPSITDDAFALVVCHEIGHLLGGAPFYNAYENLLSIEGQADYWASSTCIKKYFTAYPKVISKMDSNTAKLKCDAQYEFDFHTKNNCYRTVLAGHSLATFFARTNAKKSPELNSYASTKLNHTYHKHPEAQCRLDTYLAGALCKVSDQSERFEETLLSKKMVTDFSCNDESTGLLVEKRPACWFNPKVNEFDGSWEKIIKSKSIFGLKSGKISLSFSNHLPGVYNVKVISDLETEKYVQFTQTEFTKNLLAADKLLKIDFPYTFIQKANRDLKFQLIVEKDGEVIHSEIIIVKAYSLN